MEDFEGILSSLNDLQREATLFEHKQLLQIKAPPGSGKTRIVISRLMYLVIVCKIPASKIVVTTFGKKAAHEIKERLIDLVPTDQKYLFMDLNVGTFHSLCFKLLMKHGYRIGLHNPTIISEAEQKLIFQNAIAALPNELYDYYLNHQNIVNVVKWEKKESKTQDDKNLLNFEIPMILKYISKLKSQGLTAEKYKQTSGRNLDQGILYFYETYERDAREMQKVDFDDLLLYGYKLLKTHEACLPYYNHILVDEFQDTSALQLQIVLLWAKKAKSGITVVGDPDQCIYAFRDASPSNFKDMRHLCGKVTVIPLNQNYRSSQKIIDCCQHVIKSNFNDQQESSISEDDSINDNPIDEFESALCGQFDTDFGPVYREFTSFDQEAMHISNEIKYLTSLPGDIMKFSEIAVLVRTNRQITTIEKHMITNHIPYRIIGSKGFLSYPEVVLFMNCLKLVVNFKNRDKALFSNKKVWILEILNEIENNGIGEISLLNIHKYFATKGDIDPIDLLLEVSEHDKIVTNAKGREYIKAFMKKFLMPCSDFASSLDGSEECLSRFFAYIYKKTGLEKAYNGMSSKDEDSKSELEKRKEEIMKSKHNRIMTLKEMFLGFAPLKTQQKNYTLPFVYEFIESIDMFPVEENGIDPAADEKKSNASDINDENNRVTICTVHKSKGLEWSTVFVPGCSEKIIPCLISSNEDANNNGEKLTEENVSFEKYKSTSVSANQMIQEEKRVFYVALSRAKHLLYITAIDNEEKADNKQSSNRRSMIRSRFLKQDLIDRLNAYSSVFSSIKTVKQLYEIKSVNFKASFDPIKNDFSLKTFLKDYETYIEEKSWQLYWMGKKVYNLNGLDVTRNVGMSTSTMLATGFVSAKQHVAQMAEKTQISKQPKVKRGISLSNPVAFESPAPKASQNNFAPKVKYVKKPRGLTIPTKVPSPKKTNVLLSPKKKLEFAPRNDSEILKSPKRKPLKAPESPTKAAKNNKDNISNCDISNLSLDGDKENPYVNIAIKTEKKDAEIDPTQQKKKGSQKTIDQMFKLQRGKKRKRVDTSIETITLSD